MFYLQRAMCYSVTVLCIHFPAKTTVAMAQKTYLKCIIKPVRKQHVFMLVANNSALWEQNTSLEYDYLAHLNQGLDELNRLPPGCSGVLVVQRLDLLWDFPEPGLEVFCKEPLTRSF